MVTNSIYTFLHGEDAAGERQDTGQFTTVEEVTRIIHHLPKNKAPGPDLVTTLALKHAPRQLAILLTTIFNDCYRLGYFPTKWKEARICMILKPGKTALFPQHYRPISLLSHIAKIFEKIINYRLTDEVETRQLYPPHQFGFRRHHDTTAQLVRIVEYITKSFNDNGYTVGVFLDVEKAFDRVWHDGAIYKLISFGFPRQLVLIIRSFLTNRNFQVRYLDCHSVTKPIAAGVPQGSPLSPMLFNIYTSDLPTHRHTCIATFADDTAIFSTNKSLRFAQLWMQQHLDAIAHWTSCWRININHDKSAAILFTRRRRQLLRINFRNHRIPQENTTKYLGLQLDQKLIFKTHIDSTVQKTSRKISYLYPMLTSHRLQIHTRLDIYSAVIRSSMLYASPAWCHIVPSHLRKLQVLQNRALRIISGHSRDTRISQLHEDLRITTIPEELQKGRRRFWTRSQNSPNPAMNNIGTLVSNRFCYRRPQPP